MLTAQNAVDKLIEICHMPFSSISRWEIENSINYKLKEDPLLKYFRVNITKNMLAFSLINLESPHKSTYIWSASFSASKTKGLTFITKIFDIDESADLETTIQRMNEDIDNFENDLSSLTELICYEFRDKNFEYIKRMLYRLDRKIYDKFKEAK